MPVLRSLRSKALTALAGTTMAALLVGGLTPVAALAAPAPAVDAAEATDFTAKVNAFVSTEDDFGQDLPGAQAPNSIVKINPMTTPGRSHSGYDYAESKIAGFTHTNLDGVGGSGGGGDLLVVPTYVKYTTRPNTNSYAKSYSHNAEEATPGYYSVDLTPTSGTDGSIQDQTGVGPIVAEATTDVRTGQDRFTFPKAGDASLVVDLRNNFTGRNGGSLEVSKLADGRAALSGDFQGNFNGYNYQMYYYVESTAPTSAVRTWGAGGALGSGTSQNGTDIGAILDFPVSDGQQLGLKVAVSPISAAQAKLDLAAEMGDRSFEQVREDTKAQWNAILGTMDVTSSATSDPDGSLTELFYTHLYRLFGSPVNATSTSGTYRGADGVVREANGYTHYDGWALWDDFRKYETLAVGYPDIYRDQVQSLVDVFVAMAASGKNSLGSLTHSVPTVRYERAAVVIADAISKGALLKGLTQAWPALVTHSAGNYSNADNVRRGYIAGRVDDTLGTAYDDWAMATIADSMGKTTDAQNYRLRATNWTNLFKKDSVTLADGSKSGLIFAKDADGAWISADPEKFESGSIYQGTLWQYNWYAADDMGGMIEMLGGEEKALDALSFMFGEHAPDDGKRMLHSNANEIDLHAPYLFNYVGAPSKTQYWARNIYTKETWNRYIATGSTHEKPSGGGEFTPPIKTKVFSNTPQGFLPTMDNDAGTMSSTYVAAALGLFPVLAGSAEYQIGTPFFENVRITYPTGRTLDIKADGVSPDSYYVQSATLNGSSYDRSWITYDQLTAGGELTFAMGAQASEWAADGVSSSSLSDVVPSTVYNPTSATAVSAREFTESRGKDGVIDGAIELTTTNGTFAGVDGDDLAATGGITAANLPAGLSLQAKRTGNRAVALSLTGTATSANTLDSVDDVVISVKDAAFSRQPSTGAREFTVKVTFAGAQLSAERATLVAAKDGALDDTVTLSLSGAKFDGADGRDLVADGGLAIAGLPEGVVASAVKKTASTLALRLTGTLGTESAAFTLRFADSALTGGGASALTGDGVSGLSSLTVQRDQQWRQQLDELYQTARLVKKGSYSPSTFATFSAARSNAKGVLASAKSTDDDLHSAFIDLRSAIKGLALKETSYRVLQAEALDSWSGGDLKTETSTDASGASLTNLGGVKPNSWISYADLDFAGQNPQGISLRYVNNSGRSAADSAVEIRLDAPDGPLASTIPLPATGSSWNNYVTINHEFADPSVFSGSRSVYLVFRGTITDSNPWIVNFDWAQFLQSMPVDEEPPVEEIPPVRIQGESYSSDNGGGLKKETTVDSTGATIGNIGGSWNGGIVTFDSVALGEKPLTTLTVRYVNNSGRVAPNAKLLVYLDERGDTPFATVPLPVTGAAWSAYNTTTVTLPSAVSGNHKLIVEMKADTTSSYPYVGNFDWFEFGAPAQEEPEPATSYKFEAESFVSNSGGALKIENSTDAAGKSLTNVGGSYDNAELRYAVELGDNAARTATVRYVHNSGRSGTNARIDFWVDSREGEPFASVPLASTGNNWQAYNTATAALPRALSGSHTLIAVLRAETTSALPYVANIDWFDLGFGVDVQALQAAVDDAQPLVAEADRYNTIDYAVFTSALEDAQRVLADAATTVTDAADALRRLNLAVGQLEWKVIGQLAAVIEDAEEIDQTRYTDESVAALVQALEAGKAVPVDADYDTFAGAVDTLRSAIAGLEREAAPVISVTHAEATFVRGEAPDSDELIAALGATIDKGELTVNVTDVDFGTAGSYTATVEGAFASLTAEPVPVTIVITDPAVVVSELTLTDASVAFGSAASLTATVRAGDAPAAGSVVLTLLGKEYTATLAEGSATFTLPSTLPVGNHIATLSYAGSEGVSAGTATATVTVKARAAAVSVTAKGSTYGKSSTVTVTVKSGATAASGKITVKVAGKTYTKTLSSGKARVLLSSTLKAGTSTVSVTYAGSANTAAGKASTTVTVAKATTSVKVTPKTSKPTVGKRHTVTIRVTGITNPTGKVRISVGGKSVKTVTLGSSAHGKLTVSLPALKKAGKATIKASYLGNSSVKASSGTAKVTARR